MQRYAPLRSATQPTRKLRSATQHYAAHTQPTRSPHAAHTQRYAALHSAIRSATQPTRSATQASKISTPPVANTA